MHNVNVEAVEHSAARAATDGRLVQHVAFTGEWQMSGPQFRATIPVPNGEPVVFEADFPPPMGGTGSAPNPLAYCFWGGLACYAMTYAQEAARRGVELRGLRALGMADRRLGYEPNRTEDLQSRTPLRGALTAQDHAGAYVFLASDRARGITGTVIHSDGGIGVRG